MPDLMSPGPQGYTIFAECVMHQVRALLLHPSFPPAAPPTPQQEESPHLVESPNGTSIDHREPQTIKNGTTADLEFSLLVSSWSRCSAVCGGGRQYRVAACFYGTVSVDMSLCGGVRGAEIELGLELIRPCNYISCVSGEEPPLTAASGVEGKPRNGKGPHG